MEEVRGFFVNSLHQNPHFLPLFIPDDMKHTLLPLSLLLLALSGCQKPKTETPVEPAAVPRAQTVRDTTLYGVATDDFGMSTFAVQLDSTAGDPLIVERTHEDGTDGIIYGDAQPDDRFALTLEDGGKTLGVAINLSQVEAITKDYRVVNGRLLLLTDGQADTVRIERLDADSLIAKGVREYRLGRKTK